MLALKQFVSRYHVLLYRCVLVLLGIRVFVRELICHFLEQCYLPDQIEIVLLCSILDLLDLFSLFQDCLSAFQREISYLFQLSCGKTLLKQLLFKLLHCL